MFREEKIKRDTMRIFSGQFNANEKSKTRSCEDKMPQIYKFYWFFEILAPQNKAISKILIRAYFFLM